VRRAGVIAALVLALVAPTASAGGWSSPAPLAGPSDKDLTLFWELAGNDVGHRLLVYDTTTGMRSASARPGRPFGADSAVPGSVGGEPYSAAVDSDGDAIIGWTWFDPRPGDEDYCCWRLAISSKRAGRGFGPRRTLTPADEDTSFIDVVANPRGEVAVGAFTFEHAFGVFGRFGALGGRQTIRELDYADVNVTMPDSGRAQLAYLGYAKGQDEQEVRTLLTSSRGANGQFSKPRRVYLSPAVIGSAAMGADARGFAGLAIAEHTRERFSRRYRVTVSLRGRDGRFGPSRELEPPGELDRFPLVRMDMARSGAAVTAWSPDEGRGGIVRAALRRPGRPFGSPRTLRGHDPEVQLSGFTTAVNDAGLAVVAWRAPTSEDSVGIYAAVARPGRAFSSPRLVSRVGAGLVQGEPQAVVDRAGRVTVAWQQGQSIAGAVYRP
jgi:hypothetical protein